MLKSISSTYDPRSFSKRTKLNSWLLCRRPTGSTPKIQNRIFRGSSIQEHSLTSNDQGTAEQRP